MNVVVKPHTVLAILIHLQSIHGNREYHIDEIVYGKVLKGCQSFSNGVGFGEVFQHVNVGGKRDGHRLDAENYKGCNDE